MQEFINGVLGQFADSQISRRRILMIFLEVGHLTSNKPFDFGADPYPNAGISTEFLPLGIGAFVRILRKSFAESAALAQVCDLRVLLAHSYTPIIMPRLIGRRH